MVKYLIKRLLYILVTLWIIVTCTFFLMKKLPGTPFDPEHFSIMTPAQQERVLDMYGLKDPVPVQYVKYLGNILHGDLGTSFTYVNQDVGKVIGSRIGPSALIGLQAVLIGLAFGMILGVLAAWRHNSGIDYFTMILAVLGVSVPNFVVAALLQYFIGLKWGILPIGFWTGTSVILITHNLGVVASIADRVAVMYGGRIVETAEAAELFAHPMHPYTKALLSAIPIPDPQAERARKRIDLKGALPNSINLGDECKFCSRCPWVREECHQTQPRLRERRPGHFVACDCL